MGRTPNGRSDGSRTPGAIHRALPRMRRRSCATGAPGIPREKVLAGVSKSWPCLLPRQQVYTDQNGSYGLATLRRQHVSVRGDRVLFDFVGKSGKRQQQELHDRRVARLVRELTRYPGEVFKFRSDSGDLIDVHTGHINVYIKEVTGAQFSAKDFRTWAGTLLCACALARAEKRAEKRPARTKKERRKRIAEALQEVADHLGNTPAVCRSSYVFPAVLRSFEKGRVISEYFRRRRRPLERSALLVERASEPARAPSMRARSGPAKPPDGSPRQARLSSQREAVPPAKRLGAAPALSSPQPKSPRQRGRGP